MWDILVWIMAFLSISLALIVLLAVIFKGRAKKLQNRFSGHQKILKLPFEINILVTALGGVENIIRAKVNLSKVTITLHDSSLIDPLLLKELSTKGIIKNSAGVILIFNNLSYSVTIHLNNFIKAHN